MNLELVKALPPHSQAYLLANPASHPIQTLEYDYHRYYITFG